MGGSIFVLLVDDDAAFADAAARSFESVGMRAVVALGPSGALDVFDDAIDVVVTDIKLPAGEPYGFALTHMIRNKRPGAAMILMTAHPDLFQNEIGRPGGMLPLEIAELCRSIRALLTQ